MTQPSEIRFFLLLEDDRIPVLNHMTLGRHLDNDVLLAGEDVLDYHLRLEMTDRGPRAVPLGEASLRLNGRDLAHDVGLMPGDCLQIGQNDVAVDVELAQPAEAQSWRLHGRNDPSGVALDTGIRVGRAEANELTIPSDHVSRVHARLVNHQGLIWLQDLQSSNGTYVNGERLAGACRLFHGDEVRFDTASFQLIGRGADLTPVLVLEGGAAAPQPLPATRVRDTGISDTTEVAAVAEPPPVALELPSGEAGAFLLGASEPVAGKVFRTPMGRTLIGRHDDCDLVIRDRTVSSRHAELMVRAEGVTITNLMATNGTRVNGQEVQTSRLHDGDVLRFGRVSLVFKDVPASEDDRPWLRWVQYGLMAVSLLLAILLITYLL